MTFLLGWPLLLVGMLAAGIPVIIHLLHRQRTTPIKWGAMRFLLDSPMQTRRRRRVDQWLLLAARILVLLLLAWALARPLLSSSVSGALGGNAPADVAVIVDHSLSMGRSAGDHTLLDEAVGVVDRVARSLRSGDTLSVVLAEHQPRSIMPLPVGARRAASFLQTLHQLKPGLTDCSIPESIAAARELVARGPNSRKLIVIASDQQKSNWQIGDVAAWRLAIGDAGRAEDLPEVFSVPLEIRAQGPEISIGAISIQPNLVGINRAAQILVPVSNRGVKDAAGISVHFSVDGHESASPAQVPSLGVGQTSTVRFDYTFTAAGSHWIKAWTDAVDTLAADNSAVASVFVWQRLPVLIIDGQLTGAAGFRATQFLQAAMQPTDPRLNQAALIQPTIVAAVDSASANLDDYFAVVLNDVAQLPADVEQKLADYAAAGHGVWVILGPRTRAEFITGALGMERMRLARLSLQSAALHAQDPPAAVEIRSTANPMIAMIASSGRNALAGAVTARWWPVTLGDANVQVVLAAPNGDPLVFERAVGSNGGRVVVWTSGAEGAWNNWTVMPNFVPLVNETIYYLCAPQTRGWINGSVPAGSAITWEGLATPAVQSVDVILPDGTIERGRAPTFRNGRWEFRYPNTFMPGLYQLRFSPAQVPQPAYFGVSIDPREQEPTALGEQEIRWLADNHLARIVEPGELPAFIARQPGGAEIWKWLALGVVALLVFETVMTYRMVGGGSALEPATQTTRRAAA